MKNYLNQYKGEPNPNILILWVIQNITNLVINNQDIRLQNLQAAKDVIISTIKKEVQTLFRIYFPKVPDTIKKETLSLYQ